MTTRQRSLPRTHWGIQNHITYFVLQIVQVSVNTPRSLHVPTANNCKVWVCCPCRPRCGSSSANPYLLKLFVKTLACKFTRLTPYDYWLLGHVKTEVYSQKPANLDDLKDKISDLILNIPEENHQQAILAFPKRLQHCLDVNGAQLKVWQWTSTSRNKTVNIALSTRKIFC